MSGFSTKLRRLTMATIAFGLLLGLPNLAQAQTNRFEPTRLPWSAPSSFKGKTVFDSSWERIVIDTHQLLRQFSTQYLYQSAIDVDAATRVPVNRAVWGVNVQPVAQPLDPGSLNVAPFRATFTPVPFTSGVVAESRGMEGTLVGVKVELVD
jgi:hypothetical protein